MEPLKGFEQEYDFIQTHGSSSCSQLCMPQVVEVSEGSRLLEQSRHKAMRAAVVEKKGTKRHGV